MTDNVRLRSRLASRMLRSGDHLALHAGRLNSFDKMAAEVSTVARTRSENDVVPMDVSVIKCKGGKGKDGKGKEGKGKEGKVKTKAKEDRDKFDSKSNTNKFKKCFHCDKIGHVRADCRKKKRDDEERRNMSPQNSLNASSASISPPGLTNVTTNTSGGQFVVSPTAHHSPVCLGGRISQSEADLCLEKFSARFNSRRPVVNSLNEHHGEKLVPYMAQDSVLGITYQVTDVEGPVAGCVLNERWRNDGGIFSTRCLGL